MELWRAGTTQLTLRRHRDASEKLFGLFWLLTIGFRLGIWLCSHLDNKASFKSCSIGLLAGRGPAPLPGTIAVAPGLVLGLAGR